VGAFRLTVAVVRIGLPRIDATRQSDQGFAIIDPAAAATIGALNAAYLFSEWSSRTAIGKAVVHLGYENNPKTTPPRVVNGRSLLMYSSNSAMPFRIIVCAGSSSSPGGCLMGTSLTLCFASFGEGRAIVPATICVYRRTVAAPYQSLPNHLS
jgi:hypothetical protein